MIGAKLFHYINHRLQEIFDTSELFGGISIIVCGDFNQLSPVGDSYIFKSCEKLAYLEIFGDLLWSKFKYYELTEIMRQKNDHTFAQSLTNLGNNELTTNDIKIFQTRYSLLENVPSNAIHLFFTNDEVNNFNIMKINASNSTLYEFVAIDQIKASLSINQKKTYLRQVKTFPTNKTYGLPYKIDLKENIRYMMTININVNH